MSLDVELRGTPEPTLLAEPGDDDVFLDTEELESTPGMMMFETQALQRQIDDLNRKLKDRDNEVNAALREQHARHNDAVMRKMEDIAELEGELAGARAELLISRREEKLLKEGVSYSKKELLDYVFVYERRWMKAHMGIRVLLDRLSHPGHSELLSNIVMNLRKSMEKEPEPVFNECITATPADYLAGVFHLKGTQLGYVQHSDDMEELEDFPGNPEHIKEKKSVIEKIKKKLGI
ncbi:hypothetical protein DRO27_05315 [Candidatus Bathyarchaeota archaeon]|nr:MAG: hypothetical protein DRO27_05315 [Candidatus Bathyarchaeota archaeon]